MEQRFSGTEPIPYSRVTHIEDASSDLIVYAIPFLVFFTFLEVWYCWKHEKNSYNTKETLDPLHLNFHEYKDILQDVRKAGSFKQKLFFLFGSPSAIARENEKSDFSISAMHRASPLREEPDISLPTAKAVNNDR